jgi:hypothetical protein
VTVAHGPGAVFPDMPPWQFPDGREGAANLFSIRVRGDLSLRDMHPLT